MMTNATQVALSKAASEALRATIASAALRAERFIAVGRIPFYLAILVRYVAAEDVTLSQSCANLPLVLGIIFSTYVIVRVKRAPNEQLFWLLSVALDTVAAHCALSDNAFHPRAEYSGILQMPETAGVLISTVAAGLRLSVLAAIGGWALNTLGILALVSVDRWVSPLRIRPSAYELSIYLIFIGAMSILAVIIAATTRRLVTQGAVVALRANDAERGLGIVLADCHDARSVLTSAQLNAETVQRAAARLADDPTAERIRQAGSNLLEDIRQVQGLVLGVNARALTHLAANERPVIVRIAPVVERTIDQVGQRFESVSLTVTPFDIQLCASVVGGKQALHRVLLNLLTNACEGNGHTTPSHVALAVLASPDEERVLLRVMDNGPGLPQGTQGTSKASGFGVGLSVVRGITEASGGRFFLAERLEGGVVAYASLPTRSVIGRAGQAPADTVLQDNWR